MLMVVPVKDTTMLTVVMVEKPILTVPVKGTVVIDKVMVEKPILMIVHSEGNGCDG
jgi:hypothetical protein